MVKLLIGALLALTASNAIADNVFIYEDNSQQALTVSNEVEGNVFIYESNKGQALLTNKSKKESESNQKQTVSYGTSSSVDNSSYSNSAYEALR